MVDVHSHVLPLVDHGSASLAESISLLEALAKSGVTDLFCTSHYYCAESSPEEFIAEYERAFAKLYEANTTGIRLHKGAEVTVSRYFHYARPRAELCLDGGTHVLIELPFGKHVEDWVFECISALKDEYGITPIIAHPERYYYVAKHPKIVKKFAELGAEIQVNSASFGHSTARRALKYMIKHRLIDYVASDAHFGGDLCPPSVGIVAIENKNKGYGKVLAKRAHDLLGATRG